MRHGGEVKNRVGGGQLTGVGGGSLWENRKLTCVRDVLD